MIDTFFIVLKRPQVTVLANINIAPDLDASTSAVNNAICVYDYVSAGMHAAYFFKYNPSRDCGISNTAASKPSK